MALWNVESLLLMQEMRATFFFRVRQEISLALDLDLAGVQEMEIMLTDTLEMEAWERALAEAAIKVSLTDVDQILVVMLATGIMAMVATRMAAECLRVMRKMH